MSPEEHRERLDSFAAMARAEEPKLRSEQENASSKAAGEFIQTHLNDSDVVPGRKPVHSTDEDLLTRIDDNDLPEGYTGNRHQEYVDRQMAGLSDEQRGRIGQLWKEKRRLDPDMPNPGMSFVKILEYVADHGTSRKTTVGAETMAKVNAEPPEAK